MKDGGVISEAKCRNAAEAEQVLRDAIDALAAPVEQAGSPESAEFERGRQQGMKQERAMWELAASSQEIEQAGSTPDETLREALAELVRLHDLTAPGWMFPPAWEAARRALATPTKPEEKK